MSNNLPKFTLQNETDSETGSTSVWFVVLEGEMKGVMFRLLPDVSPAEGDEFTIAYDIATTHIFEGGDAELTALYPKIESMIQDFMEIAVADVADKIESGEIDLAKEEGAIHAIV